MENDLQLLRPWMKPHSPEGVVHELLREVGPGHPLFARPAKALAVARGRDDVLFEVEDAETLRYAVCALTWSRRREQSSEWPGTQMFDSLAHRLEWMKGDHEDYTYRENPD